MSATTIKAHFKQATVKGGVAVLQLEVLTDAAGAFDVINMQKIEERRDELKAIFGILFGGC